MKSCEWCDVSFEPSRRKRRFCSRSCGVQWMLSVRDLSGPKNARFNGGLCIQRGRLTICCRDGTTVNFARAVMEAEIRRPLRSEEIVHHINGDRSDDRVENLQIVSRAEHIDLHRHELEAGKAAA